MLDIISMITLFIIPMFIGIIGILIVMGGNMNKSEEERIAEDEAQIKYINDYNKRPRKTIIKRILDFWRKMLCIVKNIK